MKKVSVMKKTYLAAATILVFGTSAYALPALQLGPGTGGWSYDNGDQTWYTGDNPFNVMAYANATKDEGGDGAFAWETDGAASRWAFLVFSAVPETMNDAFDINVSNNGGASLVTSGYGTPPIEDSNSIAPHGIYPTYFEIYGFQFDGSLGTIGDTQPGQTGQGMGYSESFDVTVNSMTGDGIHIDLFTLGGDGSYPTGLAPDSVKDLVNAVAPFSHDAQYEPGEPGEPGEPVPEPATMLLFGTGLVGLAGFRRRNRK